jgi:hypothetical protein
MKAGTKRANHEAKPKTSEAESGDGCMSPSMRQLILSFANSDPERTWDPEAPVPASSRPTS